MIKILTEQTPTEMIEWALQQDILEVEDKLILRTWPDGLIISDLLLRYKLFFVDI